MAERLTRMLAPHREALRRTFADWLGVLCNRLTGADEPLPPRLTLEDVKMTLEERVARRPDEWIRQDRREVLRRQAEARFGTGTAERLSAALRREEDPRRLDAIALAVVRCEREVFAWARSQVTFCRKCCTHQN